MLLYPSQIDVFVLGTALPTNDNLKRTTVLGCYFFMRFLLLRCF